MLRVIKDVLWVLQMSPKWVRRYFYLYSFVCFLNDFAFAALPFIFKTIVDEISRGGNIWPNVKLYILVTILAYISIRSFSALNIVVSSKVMKLWRDRVFSSILRMKHNLWKEKGAGYWQNVLSEDVDMLLDAYHDFVYTIPAEIAVVIFMTVVVFYFCNLSGFILLITLLLSVWEVHLKEKKVLPAYYDLSESKRELQEKVLMVFQGVEGLRHFASYNDLAKIVSESTNKFKENLRDYSKRATVVEGLLNSMVEILKVAATVIGFYKVYLGEISIGTAILISMMVEESVSRLSSISSNLGYLQSIGAHIEKVKEVLSYPKESEKKSKNFEEIKIENICIGRLKGFCLTVKNGEKVAITGKSGSGKSRILNAIMNRENPDMGEIKINPPDVKIAVLSQFPVVFHRTVRENLKMANPKADEKAMEDVLKSVSLEGYLDMDTTGMSGGEVSRLALARVLLSDASVVLLDEPLAGVDTDTKRKILRNIKKYIANKTVIVISHDQEIVETLCERTVKINDEDL